MRLRPDNLIEPERDDALCFHDDTGAERQGIIVAFHCSSKTGLIEAALVDLDPDVPVLAKAPVRHAWPPLGTPVATSTPGVYRTVDAVQHSGRGSLVTLRTSDGAVSSHWMAA